MVDSADHDYQPDIVSGNPQQHSQPDHAPFQTQLEYLSHPHQPTLPQHAASHYAHMPYDMGAMAAALPSSAQAAMTGRPQYAGDVGQIMPQAYPNQHQSGYPLSRPGSYSTQVPQQYAHSPYNPSLPAVGVTRQPSFPLQTQMSYSPIDPYAYGYGQFSPVDPRFAGQAPFGLPLGMSQDLAAFARRTSTDNSPIPNFPRGPPRKPKQSGHALWVGNLPPGARVTDLKDHFSRDATDDIESVFLIAKSSCAFVNYASEAACVAAMHRFHDSRFHNVRLVCRLRRGTTATPTTTSGESGESSSAPTSAAAQLVDTVEDGESPVIARSPLEQDQLSTPDAEGHVDRNAKVQDRFFIVKSLTAQDLEASVRNGIWATQSHNEETLNKAFETAENVYLIFSANKSGEYFGYARMTSLISGEPVNLTSPSSMGGESHSTSDVIPSSSGTSFGSPSSIPTPATATAPRGRIIDDSARGTIFWEADRVDEADENGSVSQDASQNTWGRQFQIEWKSTTRLPFYRTRGLRNLWNANREVKIARDGTELEPNVGRRLISMFNRTASSSSSVMPGAPSPGAGLGGYSQQQ